MKSQIIPYDIHSATHEQILAHFDRYGFHDEIGHPLKNCQDFIDLVTACIASRQAGHPDEKALR